MISFDIDSDLWLQNPSIIQFLEIAGDKLTEVKEKKETSDPH